LLLLLTGIDPATLGRRLDSYESYQIFLEQARVWLPAVYETSEALLDNGTTICSRFSAFR
jgi:hypothetical protein